MWNAPHMLTWAELPRYRSSNYRSGGPAARTASGLLLRESLSQWEERGRRIPLRASWRCSRLNEFGSLYCSGSCLHMVMQVTSDKNLGTVRVRQVHLPLSPTLLWAQARVAITPTSMRSYDTFGRGGEWKKDQAPRWDHSVPGPTTVADRQRPQ